MATVTVMLAQQSSTMSAELPCRTMMQCHYDWTTIGAILAAVKHVNYIQYRQLNKCWLLQHTKQTCQIRSQYPHKLVVTVST